MSRTSEAPGSIVSLTDIAVDGEGSVIVGGYYKGQVDLNPSLSVDYRLSDQKNVNGFIAKLSTTGSLAWARQAGGTFANSLAVDSSGAVYATGSFGEEGFFPGFGLPAVPSNGGSDVYVTKVTDSGIIDWALTFGGTGADAGSAIALDDSGTIYLGGYPHHGTRPWDRSTIFGPRWGASVF